MRILDAGCGPGSITAGLAAAVAGAGGEATGIDASPDAIDAARTLAQERGVANARFQVADVHALPFADASFDAAFVHAVLQHLPDPASALREIRRVLKPGGVIGVADADIEYGHMIHPSSPGLDRAMRLTVDLRRRSGGTPDAGRRLVEFLADAGFVRILPSAHADCAAGERARLTAGFEASYCAAPEFAEHVVALGLATGDELAEISDAWRAWGSHRGALWVRLWCQAVAWAD